MGDRCYVSIRFSGEISRKDVEKLTDALDADGVSWDESGLDDWLEADEVNYGELETVEAVAQELHLSYMKYNGVGGGYGEGREIYDATANMTFSCACVEGEPAVTASDIFNAQEAGELDALIGKLKLFSDFDKNYPPLEIVE